MGLGFTVKGLGVIGCPQYSNLTQVPPEKVSPNFPAPWQGLGFRVGLDSAMKEGEDDQSLALSLKP